MIRKKHPAFNHTALIFHVPLFMSFWQKYKQRLLYLKVAIESITLFHPEKYS